MKVLQEKEADGESFWTKDFTNEVRTKIKLALADCSGGSAEGIISVVCDHSRFGRDISRDDAKASSR